MMRSLVGLFALLLVAASAVGSQGEEPDPAAGSTPSGPPTRLLEIVPQVSDQGATVLLNLSASPVGWQELVLEDPPRLVIDLDHAEAAGGPSSMAVDSSWMSAIRVGQHRDPLRVRVVFDLAQAMPYRVEALREGTQLVVKLGDGEPLRLAPFQGLWATDEDGEPDRALIEVTSPEPGDAEPESKEEGPAARAVAARLPEAPGRFQIVTGERVDYHTFFLQGPPRVVVDLANTRVKGGAPSVRFSSGAVASVRVAQFDATTTRVVFDLRELVGYEIDRVPRQADRIVVRFSPRSPGRRRSAVVVVDAGHGGKDPGTSGNGVREKDIVLDIARRVAQLLKQHGVTAMLTRGEDVYLSLQERVDYANRGRADVFVSVHCNAFPQRGARRGVEIYYWTAQSAGLAQAMRQEYLEATGLPDRGVRNNQRFFVIRHTQMPSVLVETGYLDHAEEGRLLTDPSFRQKAARGICDGILRYLGIPSPIAQAGTAAGEGGRRP